MKQQRRPRAAHFVRAGAVKNDVAIARNLVLPQLHLLHGHVTRAANQLGIPFEFRVRPQVQNDWVLPRLQLLMQFVHGNPRHPQLLQQTLSLVILVADVKGHQGDDHSQRAAPETGERRDNLLELAAEQGSEKHETSWIKERTQSIEEEEPRSAYT